ncbi:MAG: PAS domain S-box protein [Actinomycetota bacterium]|nr:PAS domain S-box protein [Actinomycetota bacterium]
MQPVAGEIVETLPGEPASVGRARRLVAEAVTGSGHAELADGATLLVSEVVTNAVLHAGSELRLRCRPTRFGVRVEVSDRSPLIPSVRHYEPEATTGRGLALVSALATSWGVDRDGDGKTVWFELDDGAGDDRESTRAGTPAERQERPRETLEVRLLGAPPSLVLVTIQQGDALLRELALLALGGELDEVLPEGWHLPQFDVSPLLAAAEAADARGLVRSDLDVVLPLGAESAAIERLRLVDRADALAREGRLLSAPALPEVAACRHWIFTQVAEQAAGFPPQRWELPQLLEPARAAAVLPANEFERLERATAPTVVADDANRIVFVNRRAGELLSWTPEALIGQRLTVLIPPELREAHLAGFSRLQVTGVPSILGTPVRLPALRRDGSSVEVTLLIEQLDGPGGRRLFRGVLDADGAGGAGT